MKNINEISWGSGSGKERGEYYPSPEQVSKHMPKSLHDEPPIDPAEEINNLEFPGERYKPPFINLNEIVTRAHGKPDGNTVELLKEMINQLTEAEVDIIELVADSGLEGNADMKYSFKITFQGFTGYYSWTDQWIGFDAEGQDVYGAGFPELMQLRPDFGELD